MKVFADESVDWPVVDALRRDGHEVRSVVEIDPGIPDDKVLSAAHDTGSLLITADKDFGELIHQRGRASFGVLLVRCPQWTGSRVAEAIVRCLRQHGGELHRSFTVLSPRHLRIRTLDSTDQKES